MILKINCKELYLKNNEKYEDIFSKNIKDLKNIAEANLKFNLVLIFDKDITYNNNI